MCQTIGLLIACRFSDGLPEQREEERKGEGARNSKSNVKRTRIHRTMSVGDSAVMIHPLDVSPQSLCVYLSLSLSPFSLSCTYAHMHEHMRARKHTLPLTSFFLFFSLSLCSATSVLKSDNKYQLCALPRAFVTILHRPFGGSITLCVY